MRISDWSSDVCSSDLASIRTNPESARLAMADIGSNAVASTQAGSRILRMFIPLSRDARQWAAEGSPYAPASSITAVTISGSRSCIGPARERQDDARLRCIVVAVPQHRYVLRGPRLELVALGRGGLRVQRGLFLLDLPAVQTGRANV